MTQQCIIKGTMPIGWHSLNHRAPTSSLAKWIHRTEKGQVHCISLRPPNGSRYSSAGRSYDIQRTNTQLLKSRLVNVGVDPVVIDIDILLSSFYDGLKETISASVPAKPKCHKNSGPP
uniref:Uncharacterized protein n=1 Tax=Glossina pallidipes TaxID=7398 RepID=A0A1A9ZQA2_GLOPL